MVVPSACLRRFNLPRFRNLAQTCRVFVSSRRLSVRSFRSPRTSCGILFSLAFLLLSALRTKWVLIEASYLFSYRYGIYIYMS